MEITSLLVKCRFPFFGKAEEVLKRELSEKLSNLDLVCHNHQLKRWIIFWLFQRGGSIKRNCSASVLAQDKWFRLPSEPSHSHCYNSFCEHFIIHKLKIHKHVEIFAWKCCSSFVEMGIFNPWTPPDPNLISINCQSELIVDLNGLSISVNCQSQ